MSNDVLYEIERLTYVDACPAAAFFRVNVAIFTLNRHAIKDSRDHVPLEVLLRER